MLLGDRWLAVRLLAAQDAQLSADPHGNAGAHQGSGDPAEIGVIEMALKAAGDG
jgi:hypothetical protein